MKAIGVIPARLGSTRLAEKMLRLLDGRPVIQHVWEKASRAKKLSALIVACDDERIRACVEGFGGTARLSREEHANGTSRVAEAARDQDADIVLNIQGDEPLMHPRAIDQLAEIFERDAAVQVATLAVRRTDPEEYQNPNVVKVVCNAQGDALYFSRAPIPHFRDKNNKPFSFLKHLGIYGFRKNFLLQFVTWKPAKIELEEQLEQLRILDRGIAIRVGETPYDSVGVDTEEDLKLVESKLKQAGSKAEVA